jgi:hypothetical protein
MNVQDRRCYLVLLSLIALMAAALACNVSQRPTEAPASEDQVATMVSQTLEAIPTAPVPEVSDAQTSAPEPKPPRARAAVATIPSSLPT